MSNGMSPRIRHIVSGLAAVATTALLMSTLVNSFDTRLLEQNRVRRPSRSVRSSPACAATRSIAGPDTCSGMAPGRVGRALFLSRNPGDTP